MPRRQADHESMLCISSQDACYVVAARTDGRRGREQVVHHGKSSWGLHRSVAYRSVAYRILLYGCVYVSRGARGSCTTSDGTGQPGMPGARSALPCCSHLRHLSTPTVLNCAYVICACVWVGCGWGCVCGCLMAGKDSLMSLLHTTHHPTPTVIDTLRRQINPSLSRLPSPPPR